MPTYASRCLAVLACLLLYANVRAETYHVSTGAPAALDDNPGLCEPGGGRLSPAPRQ